MASSRTASRRLHDERVRHVFDLSSRGYGIPQIAAELGVSASRVSRWLAEAIADMPPQQVEQLRATSEIRYDRAAAVFAMLLDDPDADANVKLRAAQGLVGVERDRSRLLGTAQRQPKEPDEPREKPWW